MPARNPDFAVDYNLFIDGVGKIGLVPEFEPAEWESTIEEWAAGGMAGLMPVDMYLIKMQVVKFSMGELNPTIVKTIGKTLGQESTFKLRVATKGKDFGKLAYQYKGVATKITPGKLERGKIVNSEYEVTPVEQTIFKNDEELIHYGTMSGEFRVGGVDRREAINAAIGA